MLEIINSVELDDVKKELLEFCAEPQGKEAILEHLHLEQVKSNYHKFIVPLLDQRFIKNDSIDNRRSNREKFITTQKGRNYLKSIA